MKMLAELCESRRDDLQKLIQERNAKGYRYSWLETRNYLFVYTVCCSTLEYTQAVKELSKIKAQLPNYSENYYNSLVKNLKSYCRYYLMVEKCKYQFSNEKLIEMLTISKYEEMELDSIISDSERQRRENSQIQEELERLRIESEIENSIQAYEMNRELKKASNEFKDFTSEEYREYSRNAFENLGLDELIFNYRDEQFIDDSDM